MNELPNADERPSESRAQDELAVFSAVVSAMASLDHSGRIRLIRTLATFFDIPVGEHGRSTQHSSLLRAVEPSPAMHAQGPATFSEDRAPTPKQFMLEKRPQTDVDRIACLAYYLTHYRDQPQFKTLDLSRLNTEAAQVKLSNPAKAVDNAAQAHLLVQAGQGKKQVSSIGEVYVQALPDRVAARQAAAELRNRRSKPKPRSAKNGNVREPEFQPDSSGDDGSN